MDDTIINGLAAHVAVEPEPDTEYYECQLCQARFDCLNDPNDPNWARLCVPCLLDVSARS